MLYLFAVTFGLCLCLLGLIIAMLSLDDYSLFSRINESLKRQAIAVIIFVAGITFVIMGIISLIQEYYNLLDK